MNTLTEPATKIFATAVWFSDEKLYVRLNDGREIAVPLNYFPRLQDASEALRSQFRLIGRGRGIHWEGLDEDLSVEGLLHFSPVARKPVVVSV